MPVNSKRPSDEGSKQDVGADRLKTALNLLFYRFNTCMWLQAITVGPNMTSSLLLKYRKWQTHDTGCRFALIVAYRALARGGRRVAALLASDIRSPAKCVLVFLTWLEFLDSSTGISSRQYLISNGINKRYEQILSNKSTYTLEMDSFIIVSIARLLLQQ